MNEALAIISKDGVASLSLREVSRRLNISHQAPYKHFQSRDHLLAEVISRAFSDFANHLESSLSEPSVLNDLDQKSALAAIGQAYLEYALHKPLEYRLMFLTPLPDLEEHPELAEKASAAFSMLRNVIRQMSGDVEEANVTRDALFAWATVHGLASIMEFNALSALGIKERSQQLDAMNHVMNHICRALSRTGAR